MIRKARDNVEAATMLLEWGGRYPDAAANRLYYALYHAGWAFLRKCDREVPDHEGRRYFRHDEMEDYLDAEQFQSRLGLDPNWAEDWAELRNLRVKADYRPDSVGGDDLSEALFEFVNEVILKVSGMTTSS
jgi:uncharacterized protein (UPF0332 family)